MDGITDSTDMSLSKLQKMVKDKKAWYAAVHGVTKTWTQVNAYGSLMLDLIMGAWLRKRMSLGLRNAHPVFGGKGPHICS